MNDKDLDKLIRDIKNSTLKTPTGLDWDNMNFDLPDSNKRRGLFKTYLFGLLVFLFSFSLSLVLLSSITYQLSPDHKIELTVSSDSSKTTRPSSLSSIRKRTVKKTSSKKAVTNPNIVKKSVKMDKPSLQDSHSPKLSFNSNIDAQDQAKILVTSRGPEKRLYFINSLVPIQVKMVKSDFKFPISPLEVKSEQLYQSKSKAATGVKITKDKSVYFSTGLNATKNLFVSNSNQLNQANRSTSFAAIGETIEAGVIIPKKQFELNIGLSANRLHSTFQYERYLGYTDDYALRKRIHCTEIFYHNNYTTTLDLQLGVNFNLISQNRNTLVLNTSLSPGIILASSGRALGYQDSVLRLENISSTNKLTANTILGLEYRYSFGKLSVTFKEGAQFYFIPTTNETGSLPLVGRSTIGLIWKLD